MDPVIIECAVNGATSRARNANVPITPDQIAADVLSAPHHSVEEMAAIFEPGYLQVVMAYHRAGQLPQGAFVKLYFSEGRLLFGHRPSVKALDLYLDMLVDSGLPWGVAVLGGDVVGCGLAAEAVARGGHVRVGLEDFGGASAPSNVELVEAAVAVAHPAGRTVASCAEAAALLDLPRR
jgi:3-keto-5-aminohexanoate cleavage enzyme